MERSHASASLKLDESSFQPLPDGACTPAPYMPRRLSPPPTSMAPCADASTEPLIVKAAGISQRTGRGVFYDLDRSVGYLLNRAANIIAARFSDELKRHEINLQTWRVLAALNFQNQQSLTDLANHTGAELSYLSRAVASAEERGLIERVGSTSDKRALVLALTPIGLALVKKLSPYGHQIEQTSIRGVSQADVQTTLRTLDVIYHNLVDSTEASPDVNRKLTVARRARKRTLNGPPE